MSVSRSYYPGFLGALFLVLLRVAIGWHFHYEGLWKIESWQKGDKPFSAEGYLRNSTGPFAPFFRGMVPDVDGKEALDNASLEGKWTEEVERIAKHFGFNADQRSKAQAASEEAKSFLTTWFANRDNKEKRQKYLHDLEEVEEIEADRNALESARVWAWGQRKALDKDRKDLLAEIGARGLALRDSVIKVATPEQVASAGDYAPELTGLDINNRMTAYGLAAIGLCLMLGLFTRLAALGGAAFLALIYLSMPPWPGLPENPTDPGHYLFVDKTMVELAACLAIAALPTGQWIGIDALLFGWFRRRREQQAADREALEAPSGRENHPKVVY